MIAYPSAITTCSNALCSGARKCGWLKEYVAETTNEAVSAPAPPFLVQHLASQLAERGQRNFAQSPEAGQFKPWNFHSVEYSLPEVSVKRRTPGGHKKSWPPTSPNVGGQHLRRSANAITPQLLTRNV
jgi:hypothetical protein